ncbi:hypothetical protein [Streptomyces sp. NPDC048172]|uniref:hypothetical protein n=1 Tax=Streptomyces sp. NPDC048172 TaxID=3365505 RepID=UPI0037228648
MTAPQKTQAAPDDPGEADGPVFTTKARDGGLGAHAARTWRELKAYGRSGATAEDLAASVGYTLPTVRKHLTGLARFGMAEETGPSWRSTAKNQWDAAAEHDLPVRSPA